MHKCNKSEFAAILGVNIATVDSWVRAGMPVHDKPGQKSIPWTFETAESIKWLIDFKIKQAAEGRRGSSAAPDDPEAAARVRKLLADAESKEHDLALKRREAVSIADFEASLAASISAARGKMLGMGAKLAPIVAIESDPTVCQAAIDSVVHEVLGELSSLQPEVEFVDEPGEPEEVPVGA